MNSLIDKSDSVILSRPFISVKNITLTPQIKGRLKTTKGTLDTNLTNVDFIRLSNLNLVLEKLNRALTNLRVSDFFNISALNLIKHHGLIKIDGIRECEFIILSKTEKSITLKLVECVKTTEQDLENVRILEEFERLFDWESGALVDLLKSDKRRQKEFKKHYKEIFKVSYRDYVGLLKKM